MSDKLLQQLKNNMSIENPTNIISENTNSRIFTEESADNHQTEEQESVEEENLIDESYPPEDPKHWIRLVESESDSAVKQYFNNLELTNKMLSEKENVLDIGAGMRDFAGFCIREKINDNIISLEPALNKYPETGISEAIQMHWGKEVYNHMQSKTVAGNMEQMPFKNNSFDLIVDNAAMPGFNYSLNEIEQMIEGVEKAFDEIIRVLKPGGEARLFPLSEESLNEKWRPVIDKKIAEMMSSEKCSVFIESVLDLDTGEMMNEKRLVLKKIL